MDIKINKKVTCTLNGLLVALGANMAEKASQKPPGRAVHFPPLLGLGGVLGASWGLLGALRAQEPIFIDFWSIFGRFLIDSSVDFC